jgi:tRNA A37 threonylcarbamoyladenosine dehydratase
MTIIDGDVFDPTNKNRQLTALDSTIGKSKSSVLADRLIDINPEIKLHVLDEFVLPERVWKILEEYKPDYVMDCIDSVSPKLEWITACKRLKVKIITHLGAGGKKDPSKVQVTNLENVSNCKLGAHIKKRMRSKEMSFRGITAVFSSEIQDESSLKMTDGTNYKRSFYGTNSWMPGLFGLYAAETVVKHLIME